MSYGGPPPPFDDPLAGTPGASAPPPQDGPHPYPYGPGSQPPPPYPPYPPYQPQYPYQEPMTGADQEFQIHLPKSWTARIGIIILGGLIAWLFIRQEIQQASALVGIMMTMLGFGSQTRKAVATAVQSAAVSHQMATRAAAVSERIAHDVHVTKEAVRTIVNDPTKPGEPGAVERLESRDKPPFADL